MKYEKELVEIARKYIKESDNITHETHSNFRRQIFNHYENCKPCPLEAFIHGEKDVDYKFHALSKKCDDCSECYRAVAYYIVNNPGQLKIV